MASNEIPKSYDPLIELMEDAADGAATHGLAVGLKQNTEADIRRDLEALIGKPAGPGGVPPAVPGLRSLLNAAKASKTAQTAALRTASSNGRALAMTCIGTLKPVLGTAWNSAWNAVGFSAGSLAVPANPMVKLQQLRAYYLALPGREVPNVNGLACTAAGTAQANLAAGLATARRRMTGLREELTQLLPDTDERWYALGFDKPGDPNTPEAPENLTATAGAPGSGTLFLHCDTARRAESYRFVITPAAGGAPVAEKLVGEPEAVFPGLPAGAHVSITVSAKNGAGESPPGAPVAAVVP